MAEMADIPWTTKIRLSYIPNTMATDDLVKLGIKASVVMVLT